MEEAYKSIIRNIVRHIDFNYNNANSNDEMRSAYTAGNVTAYADVLRIMGHEVDHGDWDDEGCLRVGYFEIDGKYLCRNSKIDYKVYSKEMK